MYRRNKFIADLYQTEEFFGEKSFECISLWPILRSSSCTYRHCSFDTNYLSPFLHLRRITRITNLSQGHLRKVLRQLDPLELWMSPRSIFPQPNDLSTSFCYALKYRVTFRHRFAYWHDFIFTTFSFLFLYLSPISPCVTICTSI